MALYSSNEIVIVLTDTKNTSSYLESIIRAHTFMKRS